VGDWPEDPSDAVILAAAVAEDRVFVTIDNDFGELTIHQGLPHRGILRIVNFSARRHGEVCLAVLNTHAAELAAGALITASPGRLRIRIK
jgi:predicted nuclease of predicted toxin-antitoxin system